MAALIKYTAFEPLVTGPLLYVLTRGPQNWRDETTRAIARLPFTLNVDKLVTSLKWLFALGLASRVNTWLTKWALNNWTLGDSGGKPWDWPNEIAAVTGGSGGLGSEVIQRLARKGMKIAIMDISPPGPQLKAYRNVHFYECDITNPDSVDSVAAQIKADLGPPTILFNNAGIGKTYNIIDMPNEFLDKIFKINLISHWYTVRAFLPDMISGKKGHVITTASMASFINVPGMVDYCVTKAGAMSFHEGLTQEIKHRYNAPWIRTTVVHPYWVRTNLIKDWTGKRLEAGKSWLSPLMTPEYVGGEIAKAILSGKSQQVILPPQMSSVSMTRAMSLWWQEFLRDGQKDLTKSMP